MRDRCARLRHARQLARLRVDRVRERGAPAQQRVAAHLRAGQETPVVRVEVGLDAVLAENSNRLGRYFDGSSQGGEWLGAEEESQSELDGGAVIRLFEMKKV